MLSNLLILVCLPLQPLGWENPLIQTTSFSDYEHWRTDDMAFSGVAESKAKSSLKDPSQILASSRINLGAEGEERCQFMPQSAGTPNYPLFLTSKKPLSIGKGTILDCRWDPKWATLFILYVQQVFQACGGLPFQSTDLDKPKFSRPDTSRKSPGPISAPWHGPEECWSAAHTTEKWQVLCL